MSERHDRIKKAAQEGFTAFAQEFPEFVGTKFVRTEGETTVKKPAKKGDPIEIKGPDEVYETRKYDDLNPLEKFGVLAHVTAIMENPLAGYYPAVMPHNHDRKEYVALDNHLRDALGFARYRHG